ncbi:MAG: RluA family pseudouridine synthase [Pirellulaceae bacterium]
MKVLYEDNHLFVVSKPAELPTMGVSAGSPSLVSVAKQYIKQKYNKPGNVYLGVVSRLDALVTGVVVLARTSKAAARLNLLFREGEVQKVYWALVEGIPSPRADACADWLRHVEQKRRVEVCRPTDQGAKEARLTYRVLRRRGRRSWLEVELLTGRKHQIRVQLAARGWPVVGDTKYGGRLPFERGIALHSRSLAFRHPVLKTPLELLAPLPESWKSEGLEFGV